MLRSGRPQYILLSDFTQQQKHLPAGQWRRISILSITLVSPRHYVIFQRPCPHLFSIGLCQGLKSCKLCHWKVAMVSKYNNIKAKCWCKSGFHLIHVGQCCLQCILWISYMYDDNTMCAPARRLSHHMVVPLDHTIRRYPKHIVWQIVDRQISP